MSQRARKDVTGSKLWGKRERDSRVVGKEDPFCSDSLPALEQQSEQPVLTRPDRLDGKGQPARWTPEGVTGHLQTDTARRPGSVVSG